MAQTGYTPIALYNSGTASAAPTAGNLVNGELALNYNDGKLYYKDNAGVVQVIAGKGGAGVAGGSNTQVQYNSSGSLAGSANFTYNGTTLALGVTPSSSSQTTFEIGAVGNVITTNGTNDIQFTAGGYYNGGWKYAVTSTPVSSYYQDSGIHVWRYATSGTAGNAISWSESMRIDSSGNVGIGTSSPTNYGAGYKTLALNGTSSGILELQASGTAQAILVADSSNLQIQALGARPVSFFTNGNERMRIDSSGNLLVGTTTGGTGITSGLTLQLNSGASFQQIGHVTGTASGAQYIGFSYNGSLIANITQSGTTAVLYNVTSDQRLKENIVDAPSGNIDNIKVRSFDWIADGSHQEYGVVAQELIEVASYAVYQPQNPDEMMGVDYSKLVPMMIKEIQDLKQRIATLENK